MPKFTGSFDIPSGDNTFTDIAPTQRNWIEKGYRFEFTKDKTIYSWSKTVYKKLSDKIGVYLVKNENNEVIYVGEAKGEKGGLFGRHKTHEKNHLFELFDAKHLEIYYCDKDGLDDPGQVAMLERFLILVIQPILNNDIKQEKPSELFTFEQLAKKVSEITAGGYIYSKHDEKILDRIREDIEELAQRYKRITKQILHTNESKFIAQEKGLVWSTKEEKIFLKAKNLLYKEQEKIISDIKKFVRVKKPKIDLIWFNNVAFINKLYTLHKKAEDKKSKL
ncbi:hypothetical protein V7111_26490 [Neobacillus niacini]|uniref:GIY-YIG nuclease family protein n=1 Tax=Neobacillus niacini TaxID=86668 RepID=UPI003002410C